MEVFRFQWRVYDTMSCLPGQVFFSSCRHLNFKIPRAGLFIGMPGTVPSLSVLPMLFYPGSSPFSAQWAHARNIPGPIAFMLKLFICWPNDDRTFPISL